MDSCFIQWVITQYCHSLHCCSSCPRMALEGPLSSLDMSAILWLLFCVWDTRFSFSIDCLSTRISQFCKECQFLLEIKRLSMVLAMRVFLLPTLQVNRAHVLTHTHTHTYIFIHTHYLHLYFCIDFYTENHESLQFQYDTIRCILAFSCSIFVTLWP